jgi:threonine synthase
VKSIFADGDIAARLDDNRVFLSSANSINWGRLVPQIVYYISAYCDMYKSGAISLGESIDVCVPTGNFGNIFACYIAKKMGLPVDKLVCASNKNNILTDFLKSGVYDKNRSFYTTMSPSMDILISSNLERLLYLLLGSERCAELMRQLSECGRYELTKAELEIMNESFVGYFADEKDCINTVKKTYEKEDRLIDTHTSVAVFSAEQYMSENKAKNKMLVVSTASPYKFAGDVLLSLTEGKPENDLDAPEMLFRLTKEEIPLPLKSTLGKKPIHTDVIDKSDMADTVLSFALN